MEPNELDFEVGDKIRILGTLEDGWLEGLLKGRTGIFPYRFVKLCPATRVEETVDLPQASSLTTVSETSLECSENSLVMEGKGHESHEYKAEKSNCVISETSTSPDHLTSECEVNKASHRDEGTFGEPPRSPGMGHEQPLAKDSSMKDPSQVVNGVSSQPHVSFHPQLQKKQYYSRAGRNHPSSEQFSDPVPLEARSRDYSSLPSRRTYSQPKTLKKPVSPLHSSLSLSAPGVVRPSQLSPQLQGMARCTKKHHTPKEKMLPAFVLPRRDWR